MQKAQKRITPESVKSDVLEVNPPTAKDLSSEEKIINLERKIDELTNQLNSPAARAPVSTQESTLSLDLERRLVDQKDLARKKKIIELLNKQPKRTIMIPPDGKKGSTHEVGINGVVFVYPKGVMLDVPETIFNMIKDSFNITASAGEEFLIDRDDNVRKALG